MPLVTSGVRQVLDLQVEIARNRVAFEFDGGTFEGRPRFSKRLLDELAALRQSSASEEYGEKLYDAVFGANRQMIDGFARVRERMRTSEVDYRLRLNLLDPELHPLWWECLYNPVPPPCRFATYARMPLSRYAAGPPPNVVRAPRLRVLVAIANPVDLGTAAWPHVQPLDAATEREVLETALDELRDRVDVRILEGPASPEGIQQALAREHAHVLHLVAHGDASADVGGFALLERHEDRTVDAVDEAGFAALLEGLDDLRLVVLAACNSGTAVGATAFVGLGPHLARQGIPAVVAMQDRVRVSVARTFTRAFYASLSAQELTGGGRVDVAVNAARDAIRLEYRGTRGVWDWATPVLYLRGTGALFEVTGDAALDDGRAGVSMLGQEPPSRVPRFTRANGIAPAGTPSEVLELITLLRRLDAERLADIALAFDVDLGGAQSVPHRARELVRQVRDRGQLDELRRAAAQDLAATPSLDALATAMLDPAALA